MANLEMAADIESRTQTAAEHIPRWLESELERQVYALVAAERDACGLSALEAAKRVLVRLKELTSTAARKA